MIDFIRPAYLLFFTIPIASLFIGFGLLWKKRKFLSKIGNLELIQKFSNLKIRKPKIKIILMAIFIEMLLVSSAGPRLYIGNSIKRGTVDFVVIIDVSASMSLDDFSRGTRLERTKELLIDIIDQLNGNKIAIITYAGNAFIQCELTDDYVATKFIIKNWITINSVKKAGSEGYSEAWMLLDLVTKPKRPTIVMIFTDGGHDYDFDFSRITDPNWLSVKENKFYKHIIVGIGSKLGQKIMVEIGRGKGGVRNQMGSSVLREGLLQKFAKDEGLIYVNGNKDVNLIEIIRENMVVMENLVGTIDIFHVPLFISLLLFALVLIL